jgi:hypothetical protein
MPTLPTKMDATLARETSRLLASRMRSKTPLSFRVGDARPRGDFAASSARRQNAGSHSGEDGIKVTPLP